jgi:hypothetical protein
MKTTIEKTKMTTMMIITAVLIGTIGIGAQSAYADTIDFENFDEEDLVGSVPTSTNSLTIEIDDDDTGRPGTVVEADSGNRFGFGVGGNPDDAQNGWNVDNAKSLSNNECCADFPNWDSFDYLLTFEHVVSSVSIDLYDYEVTGLAVLEIFDGLGALISTTSLPNAGDGDTITLSTSSSEPLIKSVRISTTSVDVGTAIDNIEFTTALVKTSNCTDTATDTPIDVLIKKHTSTVECSFTIEFNGEANENLSIHDTVPAEWEVTNVSDLEDNDCIVESSNAETPDKHGKKLNRSATHIWCSTSDPITVEVETRASPGKGHKDPITRLPTIVYKPTSCGLISLNDGAKLVDEDKNVLATSAPLLLLVSEDGDDTNDCDGDGLTDGNEFANGTDPASFNDEDGDSVGDGNDICPGFDDAIDVDSDGVPFGCDTDDDDDQVQ